MTASWIGTWGPPKGLNNLYRSLEKPPRKTLLTLIKESWQEAKEAVERIMRRIR